MAYRWNWAAGIDSQWHEAIVRAFDPDALAPVPGAPRRDIAGRAYGLLATTPSMPFDVFVKVFAHDSFGERTLHLWGRSGAALEFANAVRLHEMGMPVPRPLALVNESGNWGCRNCYYLMEHLAGAKSLSQCLAVAGEPGSDEFDALVRPVARLLVNLAAKGVWHRDVSAENLLVTPDEGDRPGRVCLVDARHARFGAEPAAALERMLVTLGAFLLLGGADASVVTALVDAASAEAAERGGPRQTLKREAILGLARRSALDLVAREVRKGKRPAGDLDRFARRYASARDARNYRDRRFNRSRHGRKVEAAERRIVGKLLDGLRIGGPVLDVPCGAGRFLPVLASDGRTGVGVDISAEMLDLAREASAGACGAAGACRFLVADARRLPFEDRRFELTLSMRLLHRVQKPGERLEVLRELARVSRTWVLFSFYNRRSWRGLRDRLRARYPGETVRTIGRQVAQAGMKVERFVPVGRLARQTLVLCVVPAGRTFLHD